QHLPALYGVREFVTAGGVVSYGAILADLSRRGRLRRQNLQRRQAHRPSRTAADQVRAGDQPQDREGARPHRAADATRPRRRGDRGREFITVIGGVAAWPVSVLAQQSVMPMVGFVTGLSSNY